MPSEVDLLSTHGTGTPLGDPIEIGAIAQALHTSNNGHSPVGILSNKSCYGHTEGAAGNMLVLEHATS